LETHGKRDRIVATRWWKVDRLLNSGIIEAQSILAIANQSLVKNNNFNRDHTNKVHLCELINHFISHRQAFSLGKTLIANILPNQ
jgi:hypothetical protein